MTKLLSITMVFYSIYSNAAIVCLSIPGGVCYENAITNFDGSVSFFSPRLKAEGEALPINAEYYFDENNSARGYCALVNKNLVDADVEKASANTKMVEIDHHGNFHGTASFSGGKDIYNKIICK